MLISLYKLIRNSNTVIESAGRRRTLRTFRNMNDRLLADAGISRELLEQGVRAWPWRSSDAADNRRVAPAAKASVVDFPSRHRFISETYDQGAARERIAA